MSKHLAKRFRLAFSAPSYQPGHIFNNIGFLGNTEAASQILEGKYDYPQYTDPATKLLLQEVAKIYAQIPNEELTTFVLAEDFRYYWQHIPTQGCILVITRP